MDRKYMLEGQGQADAADSLRELSFDELAWVGGGQMGSGEELPKET